MSYKTSYSCNMSESLLFFSTKILIVSYVYSINMYYIPLLLVTGKLPVKSMYIFPVSGFASPIYANTLLLFSSLGEKYLSISSDNCSIFVDLMFFLVWSICPKTVASDFGRCAEINYTVRIGHVEKCPFFIPFINVYFTGLKHVACKKLANSVWFFFS